MQYILAVQNKILRTATLIVLKFILHVTFSLYSTSVSVFFSICMQMYVLVVQDVAQILPSVVWDYA